jgi:hypothetical protein
LKKGAQNLKKCYWCISGRFQVFFPFWFPKGRLLNNNSFNIHVYSLLRSLGNVITIYQLYIFKFTNYVLKLNRRCLSRSKF